MKRIRIAAVVAAVVSLAGVGGSSIAAADEGYGAGVELSLLGGIHAVNKNDTALPDNFINVPAVASVSYSLTPNIAVEGDFTWMIPVEQTVDLGSGGSQKRKTPHVLGYQAGVRLSRPLTAWTPYLAAGAGAVTFLSNTEANSLPQLNASETMFAVNFGAGLTYGVASRWALRGDFREFVAFPSKDAVGFSAAGDSDRIWMERGTIGLAYRF